MLTQQPYGQLQISINTQRQNNSKQTTTKGTNKGQKTISAVICDTFSFLMTDFQ
jgi:hypothetical protein